MAGEFCFFRFLWLCVFLMEAYSCVEALFLFVLKGLVRIYCADFAVDLVKIQGFVVGNTRRSQRRACDSCESWRSRVAC